MHIMQALFQKRKIEDEERKSASLEDGRNKGEMEWQALS